MQPSPSLNLNHCLFDLLLIVNLYTDPRSTRIQLNIVNSCEMHRTGGLEVVVFDRFQRYVEIVGKLMKKCYNSFILQFNDLKSTS